MTTNHDSTALFSDLVKQSFVALKQFYDAFNKVIEARYSYTVYLLSGANFLDGHVKHARRGLTVEEFLKAAAHDTERSSDFMRSEDMLCKAEVVYAYTIWDTTYRKTLNRALGEIMNYGFRNEEIWHPMSELRAMRNRIVHAQSGRTQLSLIQQSAWSDYLSNGETITNEMMLDFYNKRLTFDSLVSDVSARCEKVVRERKDALPQ